MSNAQNRDLYEILEISPKASQETIERMFRYFAQRHHPDREGTGDSDRFERVLSVLYTNRKRDPSKPGLGPIQLERLTGCPREMLDFHLWYLKDKGWIIRLEDGSIAITADGVDQSLLLHRREGTQKLITEQ
jgi:hypothetical protein